MHKGIILVTLTLALFGVASMGVGQEVNEQACRQTLQNSCTTCHGLKKICAKLEQKDADWKKIVSTMGQKGNLSQETQDTVTTCLTTSKEPKKLVCDK
jgi:cytochrome c5